MEVGGRGRLYTYRYTVTTRMTSALRGAAMRDILMFHTNIVRDKVTRQCPQTTTFEVKAEADSNEVPLLRYQPTRLTARPHRLTGPEILQQGSQRVGSPCSVVSLTGLVQQSINQRSRSSLAAMGGFVRYLQTFQFLVSGDVQPARPVFLNESSVTAQQRMTSAKRARYSLVLLGLVLFLL